MSPATGVPQQSPSAVTEMTPAPTPDASAAPSSAPAAPPPGPATPTPSTTLTTPSITAAPFTLPDQHGADRSLAELVAQRPVLLVFYPFAFSGICGGELQALQSALPEFEDRDLAVVAISCDPLFSLRVYAEREGFGFPLLSDFWPHGAVARAYGVFDETKGCARRGSFLVDRDGAVRWSVVNPISEARPLSAYLEAADQLGR